MNLDDQYIYVFVRQDIPLEQQVVDVGHAALHLGQSCALDTGIPSLIVIATPHSKALAKVGRFLATQPFVNRVWNDPDNNYGDTAIAVGPVSPAQKSVFEKYRLWFYSPGAAKAACLVTEDGGANACVAQLREHSVFNREVTAEETLLGENPAAGSISTLVPCQADF